jgi:hypothetical protein
MGALMQASNDPADEMPRGVHVPRPVESATYTEQSLGSFIDRMMGAFRYERRAAARLEPLFASEDDAPEPDPEPVQVPRPVPGATEPITKGGDPPTERR